MQRIANVDYTSSYFSLSGVGKTRLKRILKYKLGYLTKEELEETDLKLV